MFKKIIVLTILSISNSSFAADHIGNCNAGPVDIPAQCNPVDIGEIIGAYEVAFECADKSALKKCILAGNEKVDCRRIMVSNNGFVDNGSCQVEVIYRDNKK